MLSIAHGTTGALLAVALQNPIIAAPACMALHFLEDYVPHWDVGTGITKKKKTKLRSFLEELFFDFPLSIGLVYLFFQHGHQGFNTLAWLGWFFALLPDFIEFPRLFLNQRNKPLEIFHSLHKAVHRSTPDVFVGLTPQIVLIAIVYILS